MSDFTFAPVDKHLIKVGDVILYQGGEKTVSRGDIKLCSFMGRLIFGDSFKLGQEKVMRGFYNDPGVVSRYEI